MIVQHGRAPAYTRADLSQSSASRCCSVACVPMMVPHERVVNSLAEVVHDVPVPSYSWTYWEDSVRLVDAAAQ
eukprot:5270127-Amphidinium_carterae.1